MTEQKKRVEAIQGRVKEAPIKPKSIVKQKKSRSRSRVKIQEKPEKVEQNLPKKDKKVTPNPDSINIEVESQMKKREKTEGKRPEPVASPPADETALSQHTQNSRKSNNKYKRAKPSQSSQDFSSQGQKAFGQPEPYEARPVPTSKVTDYTALREKLYRSQMQIEETLKQYSSASQNPHYKQESDTSPLRVPKSDFGSSNRS